MIQINLIFDYITSILTSIIFQLLFLNNIFYIFNVLIIEQPFEFNHEKSMYINVLSELRSLEKYHQSILDIKERIIKADIVYKYLGTDEEKSDSKINNIIKSILTYIMYFIVFISVGNYCLDNFIYYKESLNSQPVKSMELKLKKKKAITESKQKILNILITTYLFQRSYCINILKYCQIFNL